MNKLTTRKPGGAARLRVIPLGGLGEFGKNMMMIEYGTDALVLDMGFAFPKADQPGIDYLIPDPEYLVRHKDKIRAIVVTHGHMDHIGAAPYVLSRLQVPVYGTRLSLGMVQKQVEEFGLKPDLRVLNPERHESVRLGVFEVELVRVNHSIADAAAVVVRTPVGTIIDTGDWRLDPTPLDGRRMDLERLRAIGDEGVLLLMGESSNCDRNGRTPSEQVVAPALKDLFARAKGRIIISAFSTSTHRLQLIVDASRQAGRKVALMGRSMIGTVEVCRQSGDLAIPDGMLLEAKQVASCRPEDVVVICTGSQGEENSVLWRLANGAHPVLTLNSTDTVVFSARAIPGHQKQVNGLHDRLMRLGVRVYADQTAAIDGHGPLHVTGHGSRDDVAQIIALVRPRFLMPIHGDYYHQVMHAELARKAGMAAEQIKLLENGGVLELDETTAVLGANEDVAVVSVMSGQTAVASEELFDERTELGRDGVVLVSLVTQRGRLARRPSIMTRGFVRVALSNDLIVEMAKAAERGYRVAQGGQEASVNAVIEAVAEACAVTGREPRILAAVSRLSK